MIQHSHEVVTLTTGESDPGSLGKTRSFFGFVCSVCHSSHRNQSFLYPRLVFYHQAMYGTPVTHSLKYSWHYVGAWKPF